MISAYPTIIDKKVFYLSYEDLIKNQYNVQYDEQGWYVEVSFNDGKYDILDHLKQKMMQKIFILYKNLF